MAKYSIEDTTLTNIADTIRSEADIYGDDLGKMTPEIMSMFIADVCFQREKKGFEDGEEYQNDLLWRALTSNGAKTNYDNYISGTMWNDETFRPTYVIKPTQANSAFNSMSVTKLPEGMVDFSNCTAANISFTSGQFVELELDLSKCTAMNWSFGNMPNLETMTLTFTTASQGANEPFYGLPKLKNLTINGVLDFSTIWSGSPLLTVESLLSLINALYDYSATTTRPTLTIGSTNLAKLTNEQKAIATQKGWNLA